MIDWFRSTNKTFKNGLVGWKALVLAFPLIGNWLAWEIGNGRSVRIGEDPWEGAREDYKLSPTIFDKLKEQRCLNLQIFQ